ncbi:CheR family methyltransferase [Arcobacter sp. YIC-310]|uniref:CheR family methyltransferase n=1 Tax=Arcobacter sp. YIC-310 TaxID=3376632 RepID=UPI003C1FF626
MNIIAHEQDDILKIIVQKIEKKDLKELENYIKKDYIKIEISFLNIQIIPKSLVLLLKEHIHKIDIFTNELTLKTYLINLGFTLNFKDNYNNKPKKLNLQYIAIGGSAGSLSKFIEIIKNLPKSEVSIFIIMHQKADNKSILSNILQKYTSNYKVVEAKSDMRIEANTIYTAPAGKHLIVAGNFIFLTDEVKRNFSRPSISTTYEALSNEYKNSFLAILVCGYGADGTDSLKLLNQNGSTILIEDPNECEAKAMLENAISTKLYDEVLSLDEIIKYIKFNLDDDFFEKKDIENFLEKIYVKYGYDYTGYNYNHIKRRIHLFYSNLKPKDFKEFEKIVLNNKSIFKDLFLNISVNITTFYRNPEVFKILRNEILPKLDSYLDIKIWCAGCSSGEEPYSIAIFLKELGLLDRSLIYATDLNEIILENAKNGLFSKENYNSFLKNYYKAGGNQSFSKYFNDYSNFVEIKEEIKDKILFFKHNLALDSKLNEFQLIFCRNVIIYFDTKLKNKIFDLFKESLDSYGFLVLGESESLNNNDKYITIDEKYKIYKRKI